MGKFTLCETEYFMAVDEAGLVVLHPNAEVSLKKGLNELEGFEDLARRAPSGVSGTEAYTHNGNKKFAAFVTAPSNGAILLPRGVVRLPGPFHQPADRRGDVKPATANSSASWPRKKSASEDVRRLAEAL